MDGMDLLVVIFISMLFGIFIGYNLGSNVMEDKAVSIILNNKNATVDYLVALIR